MGHRRKNAPRRGSLAFRPRARAASLTPRIHYWPELEKPKLLGTLGYKVGMTYGYLVDDSKNSPNYGKEIFIPLTVVESPPVWVCALRAYELTDNGLKCFTEAWSKNVPKELVRLINIPPDVSTEGRLKKIEENLQRLSDVRVLICSTPREAGVHRKMPELIEASLGGKTVKEKFEYAKKVLGTKAQVSDIFSEGQFVDVISVSKGKGFAGPVKRFGVRILQNKSRKTVRGVGCIGPWNPHNVMSSVARAGQLGLFRRVEFNKRIVKLGSDGKEITPKSGFHRYGVIKGAYVVLKGTVPGPPKRTVALRHAVRVPSEAVAPKLTYIHV